LSSKALFRTTKKFEFHTATSLNKQFDLLLNNLSENHFNGFKNYLFCSNDAQASVSDIFETLDEANSENVRGNTIVMPLYQGLLMKKTKSPVIQIIDFERYHKFNIKWLF
jgi:transcription-repair coupling factor (superfamily II helicase)